MFSVVDPIATADVSQNTQISDNYRETKQYIFRIYRTVFTMIPHTAHCVQEATQQIQKEHLVFGTFNLVGAGKNSYLATLFYSLRF